MRSQRQRCRRTSRPDVVDEFLERTSIAYFSMEVALRPEVHTYAGGLGVLAGDMARSCADLELPVVFVSLLSRDGYFRQEIGPDGEQIERPDPWRPNDWAAPLSAMVGVEIDNRTVWLRPWLYVLSCPIGHRIPVLLLDTDLEQNDARDREITDRLYGGDDAYRLKQEIVLGVGGERILRALGFNISTYHLNEGHAALLALSLLRRSRRAGSRASEPFRYDVEAVREKCVFTTHTPVDAGHDQFDYRLVEQLLGDFVEREQLRSLAGGDRMNMTALALSLSGYVNGVARRHAETASRMFPGYRIEAITNGVHVPTWTHPSFALLFQALVPNWGHEPELLARADQLPEEAIWRAHEVAKRDLAALVSARAGVALDPDVMTIGFARRMTGYKRPGLLFADLERLRAIARKRPFQIVIAGKAHPRDHEGKALIQQLHASAGKLAGDLRTALLPDYEMATARLMVSGADLWLNTPMPPLEASGTSGMKAALNGALNFSVLDGWWIEACIEGVTGWGIEGDGLAADALYEKLERTVLPLYYDDRPRWIWMMKQAVSKLGSYFNSQRMMRRYASEAYLR